MQSSCRGMGTGSSMDSTQNATNGGSTGGDSSSATYKSQEASAAIASHSRPVDKIYAVEEDTAALTEARCALSQAMNTTMELPSLFYRGEAAAAAAVAGSSLQPDVFFEGIIASHDDGLNSLHDQQHHPYNGDTAHLTSGLTAAVRPLLSTVDPPHDDDGGGGGDDDDDDDLDHVKVELLKSNGDVEAHGASDPLPVTLTMSASDRNKSNGGHLNASHSITSASQASVEELVKGGDLHYNRSEGSLINGAAAPKRRSGSLLNVGDRIHALQQLVSPFGKTDTASVLSEAIGYIKFLQDQVQVLSSPYMKPKIGSIRQAQDKSSSSNTNNTGGSVSDLRSRGLCLVPVSCTLRVASSNINIGADYWASSHHDVKYMQGSDG